jgi:hypothetical protein
VGYAVALRRIILRLFNVELVTFIVAKCVYDTELQFVTEVNDRCRCQPGY